MQSFRSSINIKRENTVYRETIFSGNFSALLLLHLQMLPSVEKAKSSAFFVAIFCLDLLGDVLAHLLGDSLTFLPRYLSLNVPAVLHLTIARQYEVGGYNCLLFLLLSDNLTSFWRGTCLHSVDSTCLATWVRSVKFDQ